MLWVFLAVPSKIIREVIQRNANEIQQGRSSKESFKLSSNFCLDMDADVKTSLLFFIVNICYLRAPTVLVLITKDKNLWVVKTVKRRGRKLIL